MQLNSLTAISPIDGRYGSKTADLRPIFSEYGLYPLSYRGRDTLAAVARRARASTRYLPSVAQPGGCSNRSSPGFQDRCPARQGHRTHHQPRRKAVEYLIKGEIRRQRRARERPGVRAFRLHLEDINNLSHAMMLREGRDAVLLPQADAVDRAVATLAHGMPIKPMLSRTHHGQPASPTTLGKELANVVARLLRQREQIAAVR